MKQKPSRDVVELFHRFQKDVLHNKPEQSQMVDDVRMMRFKIRPVTGDIGALNFDNTQFIETLWSLGKLDEFFHEHISSLSKDEKQIFFRLFDGLYQEYQNKLSKINIKSEEFEIDRDANFEVEIFREKASLDN